MNEKRKVTPADYVEWLAFIASEAKKSIYLTLSDHKSSMKTEDFYALNLKLNKNGTH